MKSAPFYTRLMLLYKYDRQRHYNYLKKHNPTVIDVMRMNETLEQYMRDIDCDAEEMFSQLVKQLAESEGITEQLKAENQMLWVQSMNNITNSAKEIVLKELIYI